MSRKSAVIIAIVSSLMAAASPAVAGQTISDRSYWPGEIAANRSQLKATPAGRLSSFAFDIPGPQAVEVIQGSDANGRYQGGPHPRVKLSIN
jgi:hypothetical protein